MDTQEKCDKHRKINRDSMMRKRQTETDEQGAKRKMTMRECVSKERQNVLQDWRYDMQIKY